LSEAPRKLRWSNVQEREDPRYKDKRSNGRSFRRGGSTTSPDVRELVDPDFVLASLDNAAQSKPHWVQVSRETRWHLARGAAARILPIR
jgi:hypothetical protein